MMFIGYCYFIYVLRIVNVSNAFNTTDILFNLQLEEVIDYVIDFKSNLTNDSWIITKEDFNSNFTPFK